MNDKKAKAKPKEEIRERAVDIHIEVFKDGSIEINAPPDVRLFHEVITQAERIMNENYGPKKEEKKIVELPRIVLAKN